MYSQIYIRIAVSDVKKAQAQQICADLIYLKTHTLECFRRYVTFFYFILINLRGGGIFIFVRAAENLQAGSDSFYLLNFVCMYITMKRVIILIVYVNTINVCT